MSITVAENMANARRIRDEKRELRARYVAALEELETNLEALLASGSTTDGARVRISLGKIKAIRAEMGGKR